MKRPVLNEIPLDSAMSCLTGGKSGTLMTMAPEQWDTLLLEAYENGWTILEVDTDEKPIRAFRKEGMN